ncbi:MAG TPA: LmeA family phospholipid-binding protein [Drouetiella sp.]
MKFSANFQLLFVLSQVLVALHSVDAHARTTDADFDISGARKSAGGSHRKREKGTQNRNTPTNSHPFTSDYALDAVSRVAGNGIASGLTVATPVLVVPRIAPNMPAKKADPAIAVSGGDQPFPIGSKLSRTVQRVTGVTFLSDMIAGQAAKQVLRKQLGGNVKVKVKTYGLTDLIAGKVKSVSVSSKGGAYKNVPLGDMKVASKGPIWYQYKHKEGRKTGLQTPVLLDVSGELRTQDVVEALGSERIAKQMRGLKLDLPGLGEQQLQVKDPKVVIGENVLTVDAVLVTVGGATETGVPIKVSGTPVLEGDKIFLRHLKVESPDIVEPDKFATFAEELLNPIVDFARMDRKDYAFRLQQLSVKKDIVEGGGQILLAPRKDPSVAQTHPAGSK